MPGAPQNAPQIPIGNPNIPSVHQTPRQQPATPQNPHQTPMMAPGQIPVQQPSAPMQNITSYHQGLANGLQNQMHGVVQAQQGIQSAYPMMNNPYQNNPMAAQAAQMANNMGNLTAMQRQQLLAYQMAQRQQLQMQAAQAAQAGMQMHPQQQQQHPGIMQQFGNMATMQQGMQPNQHAQQLALLQQQQRQMQLARINQTIIAQAEARVSAMSPQQIQDLLATATEQHRNQPAWQTMDDRAKARVLASFQIRLEFQRARQQQLTNQAASNAM